MKKILLALAVGIVTVGLASGVLMAQSGQGYRGMGQGHMMQGRPGVWVCPWASGWHCPWMGGWGGSSQMYQGNPNTATEPPEVSQGRPLTGDQAKSLLERYAIRGNPNLKVGRIDDRGAYYEAEIVDSAGRTVQRIQVNKETGWFRQAP